MGECPLNCANRQQRKGGDPVSHCLSPRLAAPVSWILPAMGVHAIWRVAHAMRYGISRITARQWKGCPKEQPFFI